MSIIIITVAILNLILGIFVWLKNWKNRANSIFALFCFFSFLMGLFNYFHRIDASLLFLRLTYAAGVFLPALAILWGYEIRTKKFSNLRRIITVLPVPFMLFLSLSSYIVKDVGEITELGITKTLGPLFPLYYLYVATFMFYGIFLVYRARGEAAPTKRLQLTYSFLGFIFYALAASTVSLFLPMIFGINDFSSLDTPSSLFFVSLNFYAIYRYRLLGVRMFFSRIYTYLFLAVFAFVFFYSAYPLVDYAGGLYTIKSAFIGLMMAILYVIVFIPFLGYVRSSSDLIFYKGKNPEKMVKDLAINFLYAVELKEFFEILERDLRNVLTVRKTGIIIYGQMFDEKFKCGFDLPVHSEIIKTLLKKKSILLSSEVEKDSTLKEELTSTGVRVAIPLVRFDHVIGIIILSEKVSKAAYTKDDIEFLERLSFYITEASVRLLRVQAIKDNNYEISKLHDRFFSVLSGQFHTPINIVNNILGLLEKNDLSDDERKGFLGSCKKRIESVNEVLEDFILASEIEGDMLKFDLTSTNINDLMRGVITEKKVIAEDKNISILFEPVESSNPFINSNRPFLRQVFVNLLNNAIKYSPRNSAIKVRISELDYKGRKSIQIKIHDSGIGIPEESRDKVFNKFFRADNVINNYIDGSGLGLFNVKEIVKRHEHSDIFIEKSELGSGAVFVLVFEQC